nr:T9SS type A sorting domain-containing protein [uncultured Psychroserpens sp.]
MKKITLLVMAIIMTTWLSFSQTPTTVATLNVNACLDSQSTNVTYDGGVVWVEVVYDGTCTSLSADTESSDFDTEIGIYDESGNLIGSNDDGGTGALSLFTANALTAGTYYVAAGGFNTTFAATLFNVTTTSTVIGGSLSINISTTDAIPPGPDNDNLADAIPISCGNTYTGDTTTATIDEEDAPDEATIEEDTAADTDSPNVWYSFMGTGDIVTLSTCGTGSFDTEIFVFTGASGDLTCIDDGYDECGSGDGFAAETTFTSVVGTTYLISIEGFNSGNVGAFGLVVTCVAPPACTPAVVDSSEIIENCNPDGTGTFNVDIVVSDAGDAGSVFDDGTNTYPVIAGTVTVGPYNSGEFVTIELIAVDEDCSFTVGTFGTTCPLPVPDNDECVDATPIECGDTITGETLTATNSGNSLANDVWYELSGTTEGQIITASLCGSDYDTLIRVFDACGGNSIASNDDAGVCSPQSETSFTSNGISTYYIMVEGFGSNNGNFSLAVTCEDAPTPPENDDVAGALNLPVGNTVCETLVAGTNIGATTTIENDNEASCSSFDPAGDVWFKAVVPASGELNIEVSTADIDPIGDSVMEVYSGASGALLEVACDDDGGSSLFSLVELTGLTPGDVLLIRVWEFGDNLKGNFNMCAWSPNTLGFEDEAFGGFKYFPNPINDVLTLESQNPIDRIEVFNVLGQRIVVINSANTIQNIDLSSIQTGAYFVKVSIKNQVKTIRVIKE